MILFYNIITLVLVPFLVLVLPIYLIFKPEKRNIIPKRLGLGLNLPSNRKQSTVWIHALSVGEVTSARYLVKQLYQDNQKSTTIIFSTTTESGYRLAEQVIGPFCDGLIYYPLDILPVVKYFHKKIQPDLFILIETDFWPNLLHHLSSSDTELLLFNGRVSSRSMKHYRRFSVFFTPLFDTFSSLCMQTDADAKKMRRLGIAEQKIITVGNLKFTGCDKADLDTIREKTPFPDSRVIILAGSTHAGEEEQIFEAFLELKGSGNQLLHLVVAPRNISRVNHIIELLDDNRLTWARYSNTSAYAASDVTIIDTIGHLASLYRYADISFVGGSLVEEGGHNPLEPACFGCPVLFGPYMDDFSEISNELLDCGGALEVKDSTTLHDTLKALLDDKARRQMIGRKALAYTAEHQNVISDHLRLIRRYI